MFVDEMYQIVSNMPEDIPFNCRVCCPEQPSPWRQMIDQELRAGMKSMLDAVLNCSSLPLLRSMKEEEENLVRLLFQAIWHHAKQNICTEESQVMTCLLVFKLILDLLKLDLLEKLACTHFYSSFYVFVEIVIFISRVMLSMISTRLNWI